MGRRREMRWRLPRPRCGSGYGGRCGGCSLRAWRRRRAARSETVRSGAAAGSGLEYGGDGLEKKLEGSIVFFTSLL
uniref:Uncharacterized protein n=1 Tax=Arundo donax TaxID=35708 RepID=A0A0A9DML5_ARUDO